MNFVFICSFLSCKPTSEIQKHNSWDWEGDCLFSFLKTLYLCCTRFSSGVNLAINSYLINELVYLDLSSVCGNTRRAQTVSLDWKNRRTVIKEPNQDLPTSCLGTLCFTRLPQRDLLREPVIWADRAIILNEMPLSSCDIVEIKNQSFCSIKQNNKGVWMQKKVHFTLRFVYYLFSFVLLEIRLAQIFCCST